MSSKIDSSISWKNIYYTLADITSEEFLEERKNGFLIKVRCPEEACQCALSNNEILILKPIRNLSLVSGIWCKQNELSGAKSSSNEKTDIVVVSSHFTSNWFEVLNENGQSIPYWTKVSDIVQHGPKKFLVRRNLPCIFGHNLNENGSNSQVELNSSNSGVIQSGTVLNYVESKNFPVSKGRNGSKVKQVALVKCSNSEGRTVYLSLESKCALSPIAGSGSISGVHTVSNLINGFHFPIRVRPVCGSNKNRFTCTERYHLRLTNSRSGDLLFLSTLNNADKFFVLSVNMMRNHHFLIAECNQRYHMDLLARHRSRVNQFLQAYHPHDSLRYLLRDMTKDNMGNSTPKNRRSHHGTKDTFFRSTKSAPCHRRTKTNDSLRNSSGFGSAADGSFEEDLLMDEVEDIYFYVREGHFPSQLYAVRRDSESAIAISIAPKTILYVERQKSTSCDNLSSEKRRTQMPPPLPPRHYEKNNGNVIYCSYNAAQPCQQNQDGLQTDTKFRNNEINYSKPCVPLHFATSIERLVSQNLSTNSSQEDVLLFL